MNTLFNIFQSTKLRNLIDIKSIEDFHEILKRERFRSDRNNVGFSLIIFNLINNNKLLETAKNLVEMINTRIRNYDEIGWFDEKRIAILLPDTSINKAKIVANKLCNNFNSVLDFNIISYPIPREKYNDNEQCIFDIQLNKKFSYGYKMPLWKRLFDIFFSLSALFILSPLMLFIAAIIKIVSPGPVFFKQQRFGQSGRIFNLLKFRTMKDNNDDYVHREYIKKLIKCEGNSELPMIKLMDDRRIIMFGKIIRKTCIDELPQFINVLLGEMSLVGPRPCIPYEAEEFLYWHKRRFDIVPGITGLWQVSGKNKTTFKEMIRYDIEYAVKRSFLLDLEIILKTPGVIIGEVFESIDKKPIYQLNPQVHEQAPTIPVILDEYNGLIPETFNGRQPR